MQPSTCHDVAEEQQRRTCIHTCPSTAPTCACACHATTACRPVCVCVHACAACLCAYGVRQQPASVHVASGSSLPVSTHMALWPHVNMPQQHTCLSACMTPKYQCVCMHKACLCARVNMACHYSLPECMHAYGTPLQPACLYACMHKARHYSLPECMYARDMPLQPA